MSYKNYKNQKKTRLLDPKEGYDVLASSYDEYFPLLNSFEKDLFSFLYEDVKDNKVLDIGCGTGRILSDIRRFGGNVTACDISDEMLNVIRKKFPDVECVCGDIENLPFKDHSFDIVCTFFVLVHIKNLDKVFSEVYRVLKDGGFFVFSNINQKKAPKIKVKNGENIVIKSFYHRPQNVIKSLKDCFFSVEKEEFVYEKNVWINQIVKARK